jgi:hypothetical protein
MTLSGRSLAVAVLVGCSGAAGGATPEECAPVTAEIPASGTVTPAVGEYQLRLVATSGAKTGASVEGTLSLQPQPDALRYRTGLGGTVDTSVVHPLYGSADVDLAAVDAVSVGSTTSKDPMQPGVLVVERHTSGDDASIEIVVRLGSEANRRDRQRFDGGYTVLRVRHVSDKRMAGTWASGITAERAAGYFCARKLEER